MNRGRISTWCAALTLCANVAMAAEPPAESDGQMGTSEEMGEVDQTVSEEDLKTARLHFANGLDLLNEKNYQDAYYQFQLALEKSGGSWKVQGNLGFCALKLERDGEALDHYRRYLEEGKDEIDPVERSQIEKELLLLKGNLATVMVTSTDPAVQVMVKREGSSAPAQAYALEDGKISLGLRSGSFMISAESGGETLTWEPVLTPGKEASYHFDFEKPAEPQEAPAAATSAAPAAPADSGPSGMRIAGYVTTGVGVAALGGGLITGLMSQSKEDAAKDGCIGMVCRAENEDDKNAAESLATTANILFIGGGVLTAAGVSLIILGGNSSDGGPTDQATLSLSPLAQPGGGGLFAQGTF